MFGASRKEIQEVVEGVMRMAVEDTKSFFSKARSLHQLQEEVITLKIERSKITEEHERQARELEHKIGLERLRQEQEVENAGRETRVSVREENLTADRARFDEQLKFHDERFTEQVTYLKDMFAQVLDRIPQVDVLVTKEQ